MDDQNKNSAEDTQKTQQTFERVQHMRTAIKNAEDGEAVSAAVTEYAKDSTYRQSDSYEAAKKIDRAVDYASLLASDDHINTNRSKFLKKSGAEQQALLDEYQQAAGSLLKAEFGDDYLQYNTHQSIAEKGVWIKESKLTQDEINTLNSWLSNPTNITLTEDAKDLMRAHGVEVDKCNMSYLRSRAVTLAHDGKSVTSKGVNLQQRQAATTMMKDKSTLSSEEISTVMDSLRAKRLGEAAVNNESLQRFLDKHPKADKTAWNNIIKQSKRAQAEATKKGIDLAEEFLDADAIKEVEAVFNDLGEITDSTGIFQQNAWRGLTNFFLGEMAAPINTAMMIGGIGKKIYNFGYNRYLEKSKNKATQEFRKSMRSARESLRGAQGREARYNAKRDIKDLRAKRRYERTQTRRYGSDPSKWKGTFKPGQRKAYGNTLRAKILKKLDNPISRFIGKIFGLKGKITKFVTGIFKKVLVFLGKAFLCLIAGGCILAPIFTIAFMGVTTFLYMFKVLEPKYAQNCINNLNYLDKWYVEAVEKDILYDHALLDEYGSVTGRSKFIHPKYETYIGLSESGAKVGKFVDEYGKEISSGNNILPIFTAFKYRTAADINESTYVAASAYGQELYWRTHKVSENVDDGAKTEKRDITVCPKDKLEYCISPYVHEYGGGGGTVVETPYNPFLDDVKNGTFSEQRREYCDSPFIEFYELNENTGKCWGQEKIEHTHSAEGQYPCWETTYTCSGIHVHTDDCYEIRTVTPTPSPKESSGGKTIVLTRVDKNNPTSTQNPTPTPMTERVPVCGLTEHPEHTDACFTTEFVCDLEEHTHNFLQSEVYGTFYERVGLSPEGTASIYSEAPSGTGIIRRETKCGYFSVSCPGHCPGHLEIERTIECTMDIEHIVQEDDLVFTSDALTIGEDVLQAAGTQKWKNLVQNVGILPLEDWYTGENSPFSTVPYGGGDVKMYRDYSSDELAVLYNNESLAKALLDEINAMSSSRYQRSLSTEKLALIGAGLSINFNSRYSASNRYATNVRVPVFTEENLPPALRKEFKNRYELTDVVSKDITNAVDYVSPFIYDNFAMSETVGGITINNYLFRNGWGYFPQVDYHISSNRRGEFQWFIDKDMLVSVSGGYDEGYQYAIEAFAEESDLYFNNGLPPVDIETISSPLLQKAVKAVREMKEDIDSGPYDSPDNPASALKTLFCYMDGDHSRYYDSEEATFYRYNSPPQFSDITPMYNTILGKKFLLNTEYTQSTGSWNNQTFGYHYVYVIDEADKAGNWGAGEKYYYCLIYDTGVQDETKTDTDTEDYRFRFVTLSEKNLEFYESSYPDAYQEKTY